MHTAKSLRRRPVRGFTLIELLVVIVILALLAAVVIPRVVGKTEDARKAAAISDIKSLDDQLEVYKLDTGSYPTGDQGLQALVSKEVANSSKWDGPYLKNGLPNDPWGHPYQYKYPGEHGEYDVFCIAPDGKVIGNWNMRGE